MEREERGGKKRRQEREMRREQRKEGRGEWLCFV